MNEAVLVSYMTDHLAGAEAALTMLARLQERYAGDRLGPFFAALHEEIRADRDDLQRMRERFGAASTVLPQAAGWAGALMSRVRIDVLP